MAERAVTDGLVPQRGPARLVEAIVSAGAEEAVCRGRIPAASAFAADGRAPAVVAIELAAQAAAVQQALAAPAPGGPRRGYLVSVRDAVLRVDAVEVEATLTAAVRRVGGAGALSTYEVRVTGAGGEEILTATLGTYAGD
jgi:predicted hotdog family 3-hydroxylacyl-ACP dehydratase